MNSRERMIKAIEFDEPDRIPVTTWRAEGLDEWLYYKGHERHSSKIKEILKEYPNDAYYPDTPWIGQGRVGQEGSKARDEWGIVWATMKAGCYDREHPLADWRHLDTYQFPEPSYYITSEAKDIVRHNRHDRYTYVGTFGAYFQLMGFLRGYENLMVDLIRGSKELVILADRLLEYFLQLIEKWSEVGVDGIFFGDDWGAQNQLMIKPSLWREFFKPRYKEMFDAVHKAGAHVWFHSDGYIINIIPDLINIGVDVLNVNQLSLNGLDEIGERFGGKICFFGGLDSQWILPFGSVKEVEDHVRGVIQALASYEGGYIAVPLSGGGGYDMPLVNLKAVLGTFEKYGTYPIKLRNK